MLRFSPPLNPFVSRCSINEVVLKSYQVLFDKVKLIGAKTNNKLEYLQSAVNKLMRSVTTKN